jgi:hypothetical protein
VPFSRKGYFLFFKKEASESKAQGLKTLQALENKQRSTIATVYITEIVY